VTNDSNLGRRPAGFDWADEHAAQLVEFAVALPLLVLFVVGIFDFSGAYTLKQKLTNVAASAASTAAVDPSNDLDSAPPASVVDAFDVISNYMLNNNLNICGLTSASGTQSGSAPKWTFSKSASGCSVTIIINRGYYYPATGATPADLNCTPQNPGSQLAIVSTCVSIQYSYAWKFGRVASLLGRNTALPAQISAVAVALNQD
jgi:Flp pilus assembly protein TadG